MRRVMMALLMLSTASVAVAQGRDPEYAAARSAGQVGEKPDGYLGIVGTPTRALTALVAKINIQRKAVYTQKSAADGQATVEDLAFTSGCNLIAQTVPGEKYMDPSGAWQTRTGAPPVRKPACG